MTTALCESSRNFLNDIYARCRQEHIHPIIDPSPENLARKNFTAADLDTRVFYVRCDQEDTLTIKKQRVPCPIAAIIETTVLNLHLPEKLARSMMESEIQRVELYIREYIVAVFTPDRVSPCLKCLLPEVIPRMHELPSSVAFEIENLTEFLFEQMDTLSSPIEVPASRRVNLSSVVRRAFSESDLELPPTVFSFVHQEPEIIERPISQPSCQIIDITQEEEPIDISDDGSDDVFEVNSELLNKTKQHLSITVSENDTRVVHSTEFEKLSVSLPRMEPSLKSALKSPDEDVPEAKRLSFGEEKITRERKTVGFRFPGGAESIQLQPPPNVPTLDMTPESILEALRRNSSMPNMALEDFIPPQDRVPQPSTSGTNSSTIPSVQPSASDSAVSIENVEIPNAPALIDNFAADLPRARIQNIENEPPVPIVQVRPPPPPYIAMRFPRLNYGEIDGIQQFNQVLIDENEIPRCRVSHYVPTRWPATYQPFEFVWDPPDRVFSHLAEDLWDALMRGTYVDFKIVVPRFQPYNQRQTFEWPRIDIEAVTWRNHLNLVREIHSTEVYPREHVYAPRWSYDNQTNMKHLLTILGKIHKDFVEIIIDPTLEVSLINKAALDFFDPFVSFEFTTLEHPKVVYLPWKDEFRMVVRRKTRVPLKLTPGIPRHANEIHEFECYVADFQTTKQVDSHRGTVILGRRDLEDYIIGYDPKLVRLNLHGPDENQFSRTARCKEKIPKIRMIGLMRSLRAMNRFQVRRNFEPVQEYLICKINRR